MSRRGENIYKRKDQRWEGRYIKFRKESGRIQYGYVYGHSYKETKEKLLLKKFEYRKVQKEEANQYYPCSFKDWSQNCLENWKATIKDSTYNTYKYKLEKYILPYIGKQRLVEVNQRQLSQLIENWKGLKLSAQMIHMLFQLVSRIFRDAFNNRLISQNPCTSITLPKQELKKVNPLSLTEQKCLEKTARLEKNGELIIIALHLGLRIGEISALKWENIDFEKKQLHVKETYQRLNKISNTALSIGPVKTRSSNRILPLPDQMIVLFQNLKKDDSRSFVFQVRGKPMEPRLITYYFHKIREKAGLSEIHFHQLRHTFATRLLESKVTITSISELLGHRSTQMTLDIYAGTVFDEKYSSLKMMERVV